MTEKTVVILASGQVGPFDSEEAALTYLNKLGIEGKVAPLTIPLPMSDLLVTALAVVRKHGDDPDLFIKNVDDVGSEAPYGEETLRKTFQAAVELYEAAFQLSDQQLVLQLLRENEGSRAAAVKALRAERPMGLKEAYDLVVQAGTAWFAR